MIQSFLAVAESGSLSAAARHLDRSQPTLGRHIQALESGLGTPLFVRHAKGLTLTDAGQRLVPKAREMRAAMNDIHLAAAGLDTGLAGTVRITASVFAAHYVLPPIIAEIRRTEPRIQIELAPSDRSENLLFREADIAMRMFRPTQPDLVIRHIGDTRLGAFAATSYLDRRGRPETVDELWTHDLVGYDQNDLILKTMGAMGFAANRSQFAVRCDNQSAHWELVRAGCGIGFTQTLVGRADRTVEELSLGLGIPPLPVWFAAHPAMRQTPRVRRVWDLMADGVRAWMAQDPVQDSDGNAPV